MPLLRQASPSLHLTVTRVQALFSFALIGHQCFWRDGPFRSCPGEKALTRAFQAAPATNPDQVTRRVVVGALFETRLVEGPEIKHDLCRKGFDPPAEGNRRFIELFGPEAEPDGYFVQADVVYERNSDVPVFKVNEHPVYLPEMFTHFLPPGDSTGGKRDSL